MEESMVTIVEPQLSNTHHLYFLDILMEAKHLISFQTKVRLSLIWRCLIPPLSDICGSQVSSNNRNWASQDLNCYFLDLVTVDGEWILYWL